MAVPYFECEPIRVLIQYLQRMLRGLEKLLLTTNAVVKTIILLSKLM